MPKYALQIQVQADNIEKVCVDKENHNWWLCLICDNCRERDSKEHNITLAESLPNKSGRGIVHYSAKCKFCSGEQTIEIVPDSIRDYVCDDKGNDKYSPVAIFDCRGVTPCSFSFREDWVVKCKDTSTEFTEVNLNAGEWADWDEKGNREVIIYKLFYRFVKV